MSRPARNVYWRPSDEPGLEHLRLTVASGGARALGLILRKVADAHLRCRYELETDAAWRVRRLEVSLDTGEAPARRLALEADGAGAWRVDGKPRPGLDGCLDLDLQITPFTNTLPIRRLALAGGEGADIRVAYVPVPGLEVHPVEQCYTCLDPLGSHGGRYRYQGPREFEADLAVDADGLVLDYPGLFARVWPR